MLAYANQVCPDMLCLRAGRWPARVWRSGTQLREAKVATDSTNSNGSNSLPTGVRKQGRK